MAYKLYVLCEYSSGPQMCTYLYLQRKMQLEPLLFHLVFLAIKHRDSGRKRTLIKSYMYLDVDD